MRILSLDPGFYNFAWVLLDTKNPSEPLAYDNVTIGSYGTDTKSRITEMKRLVDLFFELICPEDTIIIESQFTGHMRNLQIILLTLLTDHKSTHVIHPIHVKKYFKYQSKGYRNNKIESAEAAKKLAPSVFHYWKGRLHDLFPNSNQRIHDVADAYMQAIYFGCSLGHISNAFITPIHQHDVKIIAKDNHHKSRSPSPPRHATPTNYAGVPGIRSWSERAELSDSATGTQD